MIYNAPEPKRLSWVQEDIVYREKRDHLEKSLVKKFPELAFSKQAT